MDEPLRFQFGDRGRGLGHEQEALIRRNLWIDPREAETPFGTFVEEWFAAVSPRLEPNTTGKYRSVIDNHLLPQWQAWPMIGIFNACTSQ